MSGKATLSRSKRHHFYHTSAEITGSGSIELSPTTNLILHPTTNLIASPEGSYIVRSTASFAGDVSVGGDLFVGGSMIVTSSVLHKGDNIFGDAAGDAHKFIGTTTASGDLIVDVDLYVKTNASIDGTLDMGGTADFNDNIVTGVQGGNVLHSRKTSIAIADLTEASINQPVYLFTASPGDMVYDALANVTTGFKWGATATLIQISIGDINDLNGFKLDHLCGSSTSGWIMDTQYGLGGDVGAYLWNASGRMSKTYTSAASLYARFTSDGDTVYMASLTSGALDVYVDTMSRE